MEANWCDLPGDVIVEILSRLPVKSLLRFRSVSKDWLHMLSSSNPGSVTYIHNLRANQNPYLVVLKDLPESTRTCWYLKREYIFQLCAIDLFEETIQNGIELKLSYREFGMVRFCHGLVCFFNFGHNYVLNPSTREFVKLPYVQTNKYGDGNFGFGYLPSKKVYKVVAWIPLLPCDIDPYDTSSYSEDEDGFHGEMGCKILTLTDGGNVESGSWREFRNCPRLPLECDSLCVNGVLYWLSRSRWVRIQIEQPIFWNLNAEFSWALFSFDLEKEEWQLSSCPNFQYTMRSNNMVEFEGCLCVGDFYSEKSIMKLWMLKNNNNWEVKYSVKFSSNLSITPVSLLAYVSKGADDEELIFMTDGNGLVYFSIRRGSFRNPESLSCFETHETPSVYFDTLFRLGG